MSAPPDVVVVGGGVFGCSVTYALARRGVSVTLVDKSLPGRATSASAGGLWPIGESVGLGCGVILHAARSEGSDEPSASVGPEPLPRRFMELLVESSRFFVPLARELKELTGTDIEAESGTGLLYLLYTEAEERYAASVVEWLGPQSGACEEWTPEEAWHREPLLTRDLRGAVYFPGDNQVNPLLLAEALKRGARALGAQVLSGTGVSGLVLRGRGIAGVETTRGAIHCGAVVNAAGAWSAQIARMAGIDLPVFPVRGQIVCTETLHRSLETCLSTSDCYLLQKAHGEIIIGSTTERSGFDAGVTYRDIRRLAAGARRAVPILRQAQVKRIWAGLRPGTPDELPILGPVPECSNYFNATGGFRTGIVAAPLVGAMVASQVVGEEPPFPAEPFLLARFADAPTRVAR